MKAKFAKGFTLIEIMVVIVIMGVLAAVAVPKLFGSVAKAKSTEIPLAASSYMKIQDVAVMEHGNVGNWKAIGYIAPGNGTTSFFKYNQGNLTDDKTSIEDLGSGLVGWEASNVASLNDCKAGNLWQITITAGESGHVAYNAQVSSDACVAIASAFSQGSIASVGNTTAAGSSSSYVPPNGKTQVIGQDLIAQSGTQKTGTWHETGKYKETNTAWHSIHNSNSSNGLYELEPKTTYTFTIAVPDTFMDASKNQFMRTEVRVYTDDDLKENNSGKPAIVLGSTLNKAETDPNEKMFRDSQGNYCPGNGYNTGSGKDNGYNAEATVKTENGMVITTVTMTTGNETSYFGANLFLEKTNWDAKKVAVVESAISKATLIKTGDTDKEEKSSN